MRSSSIVPAASLLLALVSLLPLHSASLRGNQGECPEGHGDTLTLTFTGDLLLDRGVRRVIESSNSHQGSPDSLRCLDCLFSSSIDSLFRTSQVVVANLECPATKVKAPVFKRFIFRAEPEWLPALRHHGITHLNLANNHSIDQGRQGLMDTRQNIIAAGMTPIGAGSNMQEASQPVLLATLPLPTVGAGPLPARQDNVGAGLLPARRALSPKLRRVWLLSSERLLLENFALLTDRPCVSQEPMDSLLRRVSRLRQEDPQAVIVISLHWGGEHTLQPVPAQRLDAHRLIDAGADALICHHTHTLQTIETYRGRPIYYSVGNFIFDQQRPINSRACLVQLKVTTDSIRAVTVPIVIRNCQPQITQLIPNRS